MNRTRLQRPRFRRAPSVWTRFLIAESSRPVIRTLPLTGRSWLGQMARMT